ncbi:hypothetical protein P7K49_012284 [Saguinus oedipus]|uniref:Uncharacterized protein n=1 Tax=Saguinus oedipus TaxID=9490 RepID=A0ABQ9VWL6_SAGOE|nr:hypothetical protein P7K49_012284 [Saguinus oedipus]
MNHTSEENTDTESRPNDNFFATPGPTIQQLGKSGLCALDCQVVSVELFHAGPSQGHMGLATVDNFLDELLAADLCQIHRLLSKYNSNVATPIAIKAMPPSKRFLKHGQNIRDASNKELNLQASSKLNQAISQLQVRSMKVHSGAGEVLRKSSTLLEMQWYSWSHEGN